MSVRLRRFSVIVVAQPTQQLTTPDASGRWRLLRPVGKLLLQALVRASFHKILDVLLQHVPKMPFTQNNDLVEAFFPHAAHPAFRVGVEVGRPRWQLNHLAPARPGQSVEFLAEFLIAVVKDEPGKVVMLRGEIAQQVNHRLRMRMLRQAEQLEAVCRRESNSLENQWVTRSPELGC